MHEPVIPPPTMATSKTLELSAGKLRRIIQERNLRLARPLSISAVRGLHGVLPRMRRNDDAQQFPARPNMRRPGQVDALIERAAFDAHRRRVPRIAVPNA